jgi:hypothetical protein
VGSRQIFVRSATVDEQANRRAIESRKRPRRAQQKVHAEDALIVEHGIIAVEAIKRWFDRSDRATHLNVERAEANAKSGPS